MGAGKLNRAHVLETVWLVSYKTKHTHVPVKAKAPVSIRPEMGSYDQTEVNTDAHSGLTRTDENWKQPHVLQPVRGEGNWPVHMGDALRDKEEQQTTDTRSDLDETQRIVLREKKTAIPKAGYSIMPFT